MAKRSASIAALTAAIATSAFALQGCGETTGSVVPSSLSGRESLAQAQPAPPPAPVPVPMTPPAATPGPAPAAPVPSSQREWTGEDGSSGHPEMRASAIRAAAANFQGCLERLYPLAAKRGVSRATFDRHVKPLTPDLRLMDLMDSQPEFSKAFWDYLEVLVNDTRVQNGLAMLEKHRNEFAQVEKAYGVERYVIAAIWGVETNYGTITGDRPVVRSTATLACVGRRQAYFRDEFLATLEILHRNDVAADKLKGSWAGAFGHTQFMPTTFKRYAVDFNKDGRRDIVDTPLDMIASTANKISKAGWVSGSTWGYEVALPKNFNHMLADRANRKPLREWEAMGVKRANGQPFPRPNDQGFVLVPAGAQGPAFVMLPNFNALMRYNPAEAYALAIGHLSDRLRGGGAIVQSWPRHEPVLSRDERRELQELLVRKGFDPGTPSGRLGPKTRSALRAYQASVGLPPDGFATASVLARLRR
jgi:membrane-bound lytic murein transglycosylase B